MITYNLDASILPADNSLVSDRIMYQLCLWYKPGHVIRKGDLPFDYHFLGGESEVKIPSHVHVPDPSREDSISLSRLIRQLPPNLLSAFHV
jgi:hypothetical protein